MQDTCYQIGCTTLLVLKEHAYMRTKKKKIKITHSASHTVISDENNTGQKKTKRPVARYKFRPGALSLLMSFYKK